MERFTRILFFPRSLKNKRWKQQYNKNKKNTIVSKLTVWFHQNANPIIETENSLFGSYTCPPGLVEF